MHRRSSRPDIEILTAVTTDNGVTAAVRRAGLLRKTGIQPSASVGHEIWSFGVELLRGARHRGHPPLDNRGARESNPKHWVLYFPEPKCLFVVEFCA
jgi:hypothetical protein